MYTILIDMYCIARNLDILTYLVSVIILKTHVWNNVNVRFALKPMITYKDIVIGSDHNTLLCFPIYKKKIL